MIADLKEKAGRVDVLLNNAIEHGAAPSTPAAVVSGGTRREQRVATGTLETLAERAAEADIGGPALIIVGSVAHDFIPHAWGLYAPSAIEIGILLGSFSLFFFLFLLFAKHLPSVSMTELKEALVKGATHAR